METLGKLLPEAQDSTQVAKTLYADGGIPRFSRGLAPGLIQVGSKGLLLGV